MKVRCIARRPTPSQVAEFGFSSPFKRDFHVTIGKQYLVLALEFISESNFYGRGVLIEAIDDFGDWAMFPLLLFDVVDPRLSRYWIAQKTKDNSLMLGPPSFFRRYYHDDLTDGAPEIVADFRQVTALLEAEYEEDPESHNGDKGAL
jgi:hypothetical protein